MTRIRTRQLRNQLLSEIVPWVPWTDPCSDFQIFTIFCVLFHASASIRLISVVLPLVSLIIVTLDTKIAALLRSSVHQLSCLCPQPWLQIPKLQHLFDLLSITCPVSVHSHYFCIFGVEERSFSSLAVLTRFNKSVFLATRCSAICMHISSPVGA